jgi:hypothetical protein
MSRNKKIKIIAISINILIAFLFVYASFLQWEMFSGNNQFKTPYTSSQWDPLTVNVVFHTYNNGQFSTITSIFIYPNLPFILFVIATFANVILFIMMKTETPSTE